MTLERILVVEDDQHKRAQIVAVVESVLPGAQLLSAASVRSASEIVMSTRIDLILLDMSLPVFDVSPKEDGLTHLNYGGTELLEFVDRHNLGISVLVVSAFDVFGKGQRSMTIQQLDVELTRQYPDIYRGQIGYSATIQGWESALRSELYLLNEPTNPSNLE